MTEIERLQQDIERLRNDLEELVDAKNNNLSDPEIIFASQILNAAITKYIEVLERKMKTQS